MARAICQEATLRHSYLEGAKVDTVYFGGGTPSMLSNAELGQIMDCLHQLFNIDPEAEVTLEGNPDDLNASKLKELRKLGVNRLSIGIQSFDDEVLRWMNRAHNATEASTVVSNAREAGFDNLSIDLIYGVPVGPPKRWEEDVAKALALKPEHISAYCLTIEPNTAFGRWDAQGKLPLVEDEQGARDYEVLVRELANAGYEHYEVSNFALPQYYSKHNSSYWKQVPYLGLGPSAHSYNRVSREYAVANNARYLRSVENGEVPITREVLSVTDQVNEYVMTSLRTIWGCDMEKIQIDYGISFSLQNANIFTQWVEEGLAKWRKNALVLTEKGLLFADGLAEAVFLDDSEAHLS